MLPIENLSTISGSFITVGLTFAILFLTFALRSHSWTRSIIKTAPLVCFTVAAYASVVQPWLILAFGFSVVGDFALSRPGKTGFLVGLGGFAMAHVMFVVAFYGVSGVMPWVAFTTAILPAMILTAAAVSTEVWLAPFTGPLRWPVRIYVLLLTLMGLSALTLPSSLMLATIGAGLFIASDALLSLTLFRLKDPDPRRNAAGLALWVLYIAGQAFILLAMVGSV